MHNYGIGRQRDWNLAKRFYDHALSADRDAYWAVQPALLLLGFQRKFSEIIKFITVHLRDENDFACIENVFLILVCALLLFIIIARLIRTLECCCTFSQRTGINAAIASVVIVALATGALLIIVSFSLH